MPGRTPHEALIQFGDTMQETLQCIALGRFALQERSRSLQTGTVYPVSLNKMNSVSLKSPHGLNLIVGQRIEIYETGSPGSRERYAVRVLSYLYGISRKDRNAMFESEVLHFHWDREVAAGTPYPLGHLHVGQGILAQPTFMRPGDFHNAHIPTDRVSLEAVVRFAITELEVEPLKENWRQTLDDSEAAFRALRTG